MAITPGTTAASRTTMGRPIPALPTPVEPARSVRFDPRAGATPAERDRRPLPSGRDDGMQGW